MLKYAHILLMYEICENTHIYFRGMKCSSIDDKYAIKCGLVCGISKPTSLKVVIYCFQVILNVFQ